MSFDQFESQSTRNSSESAEVRRSFKVVGMDCAECARAVEQSLRSVEGVIDAGVSLGGERATVRLDPGRTDIDALRSAVKSAGYDLLDNSTSDQDEPAQVTRKLLQIFGLIIGVVLVIVVVGEVLGVFDQISDRLPWFVWLSGILIGGYPIFRNVVIATRQGRIIAHTLMTVGAVAAMIVGAWPTAAVVVFFMRIGEYIERMTMNSARVALRDLTAMMPRQATVLRAGLEAAVPVDELTVGDVVLVRPGERIPADGEVLAGAATVNQAAITGESMPIDASIGDQVFAATIAEHGSLTIRVDSAGEDTTFGQIIQLVEDAESHKGRSQRLADGFAYLYLPVVITVAILTLLIGRDPMAMTAVLVVACSCSFALATPIAILASVGSAAKRGLLVKGGAVVEALAQADILLIDKTGTLSFGRPTVQSVQPIGDIDEAELFALAAAAEAHSEHPVGRAIDSAARQLRLEALKADRFEATPGKGVRAIVDRRLVEVGNERLIPDRRADALIRDLESVGNTVVRVRINGRLSGVIALADEIRPDAVLAIERLKEMGLGRIEMLTGDNDRVASSVAAQLGIQYRSNLLPEDKIKVVREYQDQGLKTVMIGDGVNDAPALAQADAGIALGISGTDVAIDVASVSLMRDDWRAVPELFHIARRTLRVIKLNLGFTALYNLAGLSLAAVGILPPVLAAAAQAIPDVGILANSSRLLRHKQASEFPTPADPSPDESSVVRPAA